VQFPAYLAASLSGRTTYESTISTTAARRDFWAFAESTSRPKILLNVARFETLKKPSALIRQ
jgi:hypothetical protein